MKLYIETSVPNMLRHDDAPDKRRVTALFVEWLVNPNKVARLNAVNREQGWPLIRIHTPQEVMGL